MTTEAKRLQADLDALAQRETEANLELREATDQARTVRARALAAEIQRIARRRSELLLLLPNC